MKQQLLQMAQDSKVAATVAGSTTVTSMFELIQGGISVFAIASGAALSLSLIIIHWQRWCSEKKEHNRRMDMEAEDCLRKTKNYELENLSLHLKIKVLRMDLEDERKNKK